MVTSVKKNIAMRKVKIISIHLSMNMRSIVDMVTGRGMTDNINMITTDIIHTAIPMIPPR